VAAFVELVIWSNPDTRELRRQRFDTEDVYVGDDGWAWDCEGRLVGFDPDRVDD